jgi:ribosomal protein S12 methylthiotransferase accessory factor
MCVENHQKWICMHLISKSSSLEDSINKMEKVLSDFGCMVTYSEEKHPLEHCYSITLRSVEAPDHLYSNGKGILSDASKASALGEYIERLQTNNFFSDFYLPKRTHYPDEVAFKLGGGYLNEELLALYDPHSELRGEDWVDYNSDYTDRVVSLPFVRLEDGKRVYFPINILNNLYVSNGLSSGNTPLEAQVQALSEIFERYVKIEIIKKGYALPKYPEGVLVMHKKVYEDVLSLRELGYIVEVLDASLGGRFPVTAISLINPKDSTLMVSFGSHPIESVSLERTMTELLQGRGLDNLNSFEQPTFDMSIVSDSFNIESHFIDSNGKIGFSFLSSKKSFEYASWGYQGKSSQEEFDFLSNLVTSMGKKIYVREYTYLGFYSCQMIVPSLSEVYPIEDLIYNNKNSGKWIREMVLHFEEFDGNEILQAIEDLDDTLDVGKYIGVIFKNSFTMQEFKAQIHLLLGNIDEALALLEFGDNNMGHIVAELIRMGNAEYSWSEYEGGLCDIYGTKRVRRALRILEGDEFFIDVTLHQNYLTLLDIYDRLNTKKLAII